jgi:anti-sigma-K factor RskA
VNEEDDDRLRDDAAAWLLGALGPRESAAFERRMDASPAARREVEGLREAAEALPHAADPMSPPPELRARIMAVVEAEAEVLRAAGAEADRPPARSPGWRSLLRPVPLAAAACALLLLGVVAGVLIAGGGSGDTRTVAARVADMPGASGHVQIDGDRAELVVDGMRTAGADRVYQVWVLHRGHTEAAPAGALFDVDRSGHGVAALPGGVGDVTTVMVTSEPEGGSSKPTSRPVVTAALG